MVSHQGSMPQDLSGFQQEMSFMQQINNPNFPKGIFLFSLDI